MLVSRTCYEIEKKRVYLYGRVCFPDDGLGHAHSLQTAVFATLDALGA